METKYYGLSIFIGLVMALILGLLIKRPESNIKLDLPEEISQATSNDTLIAIKKGDTIFVEFKN